MASSLDAGGKKRVHDSEAVSVTKAKRGLFLVKVPRYLSDEWERNAGSTVGKLSSKNMILKSTLPTVSKSKTVTQKQISQSITSIFEGDRSTRADIPKEHSFIIRDPSQTMVVLSEDKSHLEDEAGSRTGKLAIEGRVISTTSDYYHYMISH
jgi:transcription initiation factor TFIIF subunit beta